MNSLQNETKNLSLEIETLKKQSQSYEQLKTKYQKLENEFKDKKAISEIYAKDAKESHNELEAKIQVVSDLKEKIKKMEMEAEKLKTTKSKVDKVNFLEALQECKDRHERGERYLALLKHPNHPSKAQDKSEDDHEDIYNDDSNIETKSFEMNAAFMELSVDETSKIATFHDELDPLALATTQIIDDVQDANNETSFFGDGHQTVIENLNDKEEK